MHAKKGGVRVSKRICVQFSKKGHYWLDAGLLGLIMILDQLELKNVDMSIENNKLTLAGDPDDVEYILQTAYDKLVDEFYNVSTKKQIEEKQKYNFYYDEKEDKFVAFPKKKSMGIAELIYNKAAGPSAEIVKWEGKEKGVLPDKFKHIQQRMDEFIDTNGLVITTSGLLLNGPNEVRPKLNIAVQGKKKLGVCYLCGEESTMLENANQTIYPLITGGSGVLSFNSEGGKPEKICWKCSLLGKFVPVSGFYLYQGAKDLYIFIPYSLSLQKMKYLYRELQSLKHGADSNLFSNFKPDLGNYIQHPYEVTFAFLYCIYSNLLCHKEADEDEGVFDIEAMWDFTLNKAPIEFLIVHSRKEGNTFSGKLFQPFKDSVYVFRLFDNLRKSINTPFKNVLSYLIDYSQSKNEAKTFDRNKILERMLKKLSILDLVEQFVYKADSKYFRPLFDLLLVYEILLKEGDDVHKEEQEAAVKLGRCIGMAVGNSQNGKKGDLFALRKSRKKADFLEQINRLQFKLGNELIVPNELYEGKLTDDNFIEFKQFCMISALNSYNYAAKRKKQ